MTGARDAPLMAARSRLWAVPAAVYAMAGGRDASLMAASRRLWAVPAAVYATAGPRDEISDPWGHENANQVDEAGGWN